NQARRMPRHLLFVRDREGAWAYHPDPALVGSRDDPWPLDAADAAPAGPAEAVAEEPRGRNLDPQPLPGLVYYAGRKRLDERLTRSDEACAALEAELLALPGLRVSRIRQKAPSVVLSCRDPAVLGQARDRIARLEKRELGRVDSWPEPVLCEHFVGYYLAGVGLDPDDLVSISL